jgi:hypothetical protein
LWRFNLSSGFWALMGGNSGTNASAIFNGPTAYPPALQDSGYWQINQTYLYVFGGRNGSISGSMEVCSIFNIQY